MPPNGYCRETENWGPDICDAYDDAFSDAAETEIERVARYQDWRRIVSGCGCASCGGPAARDAWLRAREDRALARRVLAYAPFVLARRGQTAPQLANRAAPLSLYSRLVAHAAREV